MTQSAILPITSPNVHRFKKQFTSKLSDKFVMNIPSQRKCLAILLCDLSLITIHISDCRQFSGIHISQDSVATWLSNGGIFKRKFVANLPISLSARSYGQELLLSCLFGECS